MRAAKLLQWSKEAKDYYVAHGIPPVSFYSVTEGRDGWTARAVQSQSIFGFVDHTIGFYNTIEEAADACNDTHDRLVKQLIHPESLKDEYR